ncbi:hypothetical protein E2C01_033127 [Portunus trituberculatus]|uniref:Uncharacterized protein n=1 Tax=Portunus trituberculatus TaxID=210409 RepID=A0A5B7F2M2_PORTR|nr:hypothetical protein [Portunus trituberculatus]
MVCTRRKTRGGISCASRGERWEGRGRERGESGGRAVVQGRRGVRRDGPFVTVRCLAREHLRKPF